MNKNEIPNEVISLKKNNKKARVALVLLIGLIFISIGIFANVGVAKISIYEVFRIIVGKVFMSPEYYSDIPSGIVSIIWDIRLPRILCGVFVGAGLSVSGTVFQSLLMNPLADPYTIGISTGSALGASIAIYVTGILAIATIPILPAAFIGALITILLVTTIANKSKGLNSSNLIIAGIIVSSIMSACISFIKNAAGEEVGAIVFWIMGSLSSRHWEHVLVLVPVVIICCIVSFYYADELNILCSGEERAKVLGVNVKKIRWISLVNASLLTAACVSVSGIIGFIGLVIPHLLRFSFTSNNKNLLPLSATLGAFVLMLADNSTRILFTNEIPVGVLTTLIGGPFFVYLFIRRSKRGELSV